MSTITISEDEFLRLKEKAGETVKQGDPAHCRENGHTWKFFGGANAGCGRDCRCSIDVHVCVVCGDCDYGETEEADEIRAKCEEEYGPWPSDEEIAA
ncbi:hypothetical protein [Rhizobium leguminosarum]|uniref:hypothetical protein n=1 Tax=Rhizobium leguminosarum TaxID=384 RepID=UPI00037575E5|nr:hypothetical protein [Rhizobium leguminosarum]